MVVVPEVLMCAYYLKLVFAFFYYANQVDKEQVTRDAFVKEMWNRFFQPFFTDTTKQDARALLQKLYQSINPDTWMACGSPYCTGSCRECNNAKSPTTTEELFQFCEVENLPDISIPERQRKLSSLSQGLCQVPKVFKGPSKTEMGDILRFCLMNTSTQKAKQGFLSFRHARDLVRSFNLGKRKKGWRAWSERPSNIPLNPDKFYKTEWKGWYCWLNVPVEEAAMTVIENAWLRCRHNPRYVICRKFVCAIAEEGGVIFVPS